MSYSYWTALVSTIDLSAIVLFLIILGIAITLRVWHKDDTEFSLKQTLVDSVTGKLAIEKVGYMTALLVSTWLMISIQLEHRMTTELLMIYLSAFVAARLGAQGISVYKDVNQTKPTP